jgi:hypothetical protein
MNGWPSRTFSVHTNADCTCYTASRVQKDLEVTSNRNCSVVRVSRQPVLVDEGVL